MSALLIPDGNALERFAVDNDGLLPPSQAADVKTIGLNTDGQLYFYGPSPSEPGDRIDGGLAGLVLDVTISRRGQAGGRGGNAWSGERPYLDVRLQTPIPQLIHLLRLPADRDQWHYRSLLGCLTSLALSDTAVRLDAKRGRAATFIAVSLDPEGQQLVPAPAIGPGIDELEIAVNACRRSLGLPPLSCDRFPGDP